MRARLGRDPNLKDPQLFKNSIRQNIEVSVLKNPMVVRES